VAGLDATKKKAGEAGQCSRVDAVAGLGAAPTEAVDTHDHTPPGYHGAVRFGVDAFSTRPGASVHHRRSSTRPVPTDRRREAADEPMILPRILRLLGFGAARWRVYATGRVVPARSSMGSSSSLSTSRPRGRRTSRAKPPLTQVMERGEGRRGQHRDAQAAIVACSGTTAALGATAVIMPTTGPVRRRSARPIAASRFPGGPQRSPHPDRCTARSLDRETDAAGSATAPIGAIR
jgi:hypothetical protein